MFRSPLTLLTAILLTLFTPFAEADDYYVRGDANGDGAVDLSDGVRIFSFLFLGGEEPPCLDAADASGDGVLNITSGIYVLNFLFLGGSPPPAPFPSCGRGGAAGLGCESYRPCKEPAADPLELTSNTSTIQYSTRALGRFPRLTCGKACAEHDHEADLDVLRPGTTRMSDSTPAAEVWTSVAARRASLGLLQVNPSIIRDFVPVVQFSDGLCTEPQFFFGSASSAEKMGRTFYSIPGAFASDAHAFLWLKSIKPEMPFYTPYRHPDVRLGQGWIYNWGDRHSSSDHWRINVPEGSDPTFRVYAPAAGRVIYIGWRGGGNSVLIEHEAPTGQKYISAFIHLRNGRDHDHGKALESSDDKYRAFAENHPNHVAWGTNSHTLRVEEGDWVQAGQLIGWAGNTGPGGANAGLDANGNPTSHTANVHLHFSFGVGHPTEPDSYIWVDPYGVYGQADTGCYDLIADTEFNRFLAPFYPNFHGVPLEVFSRYFSYYPGMGMGLRTVNLHRSGNNILVSGAFGRDVDPVWKCHMYMSSAELDNLWGVYWQQGLVVRELSVVSSPSGEPRFTAIWRARKPGEGIEGRTNLTPAAWNDKWNDRVVEDGWRVDDYFAYTVSGQERRLSIFTSSEPRPFYFFHSLTSAQLSDTLEEFGQSGYVPVNMRAAELPQGTRFSVMLRRLSGCWKIYWGMTPGQYQQIASSAFARGYRVEKVQGYANSSRYCAIFFRNATGDGCSPLPAEIELRVIGRP